ncbi:MAG: copper resistance protein CopC [Acidimicrobiia bacterium]|nr:copper resistance protein CopC [Acidimicrobiia bacterium]
MMLRRALAVVALASGVLLVGASPAFAHAELVESDPAPGAVLTKSPPTITLQFTETVRAENGGVRVFDADGGRVDQGGVDVSGRTVRMPVPKLDNGSYVVTWRVVSADSHPIQGAFTFQVGEGGGPGATSREVTGLANRLLGAQGGDKVVGAAYGVVRGLVFAGLALLIGGAAFAAAISPGARASKRARAIVGLGWVVTFVASIAGLALYGPYVSGLGIGEALSTSLLGDTLGERLGEIWLARIVVLLVAVPLLVLLFRRPGREEQRLPAWWLPLGAVVAIALAATPGLAGHAVSGDWVSAAVIADTLHVLAMAVWLGGLVVLAAMTLTGSNTTEHLRETVPRFSRVALGCVVALAATGAFQTWRQVGSLDALRSTDYGRILTVKLVLFAAIVVFAAFSREIVLRLFGPPEPSASGMPAVTGGSDDDLPAQTDTLDQYEIDDASEVRHLRRSVWGEIVLAVAVLAATALLVNAAPARTAVAQGSEGGAVGVTMKSKKVWVDFTATPGVTGANDVHANTLTPSGAPLDVTDLKVTIDLPDRNIAPIDVALRRLSPGHYYAPGFDVPIAGEWRVTAKPLVSEFDQPTLRGTVTFG